MGLIQEHLNLRTNHNNQTLKEYHISFSASSLMFILLIKKLRKKSWPHDQNIKAVELGAISKQNDLQPPDVQLS
jgi:hypothetical protein